jgi:hypothetical protein
MMKLLFFFFTAFISSTLSAQVKGYGQFGRTFFTKGDLSGNSSTLGLLKSSSKRGLGVFAEYSNYHSINGSGFSPGIITEYPISTIAFPFCTGIGYDGDPLGEISETGLFRLPSSPVYSHIESINIGLHYIVLHKRIFHLGISLGSSIGQIEETWKDLTLTISNGTNPIVEIPQNFVLIQTASAKYIDVGAKSSVICQYKITSQSSIDLKFSNLVFFNSGQMNWSLEIGIMSQL